MKRLGITQRVIRNTDCGESRDCLDQRWAVLAGLLDFAPVPLPNLTPEAAVAHLDALQLDALILSGGNSIARFDPSAEDAAPERDACEYALIDAAMARSIPVLGVCRGMQAINVHFGGQLSPITGHAGVRHDIRIVEDFSGAIPNTINSYHDWTIGPDDLAPPLRAIVHDGDGNIEGFVHPTEAVAGMMWHPEREQPFNPQDLKLLERILA